MPCDRTCSCAQCPDRKLTAHRDRRGPVDMGMYFCPVAMRGNPTDPVKVVA